MSASDRWWLAHPGTVSPVIQTVVEGTGSIDADALRAAVTAVAAACPDTALRYTRKAWLGGGTPPRVRSVDGAADGTGVPDIAALHDIEPYLNPAMAGGVYYPDDAQVQPVLAAHHLLRLARDRGARLLTGVTVTGIRTRAGRAIGIDSSAGAMDAGVVVNCAGPWAGCCRRRSPTGSRAPTRPPRTTTTRPCCSGRARGSISATRFR